MKIHIVLPYDGADELLYTWANEEKKIKDFVTAPYPLTFTQPTHKKAKIKEAPLSAEKLKAFFNI